MKNHFLEYNGNRINCEIKKRKKSKNYRMHIGSDGIVKVSIPYYTSYRSAKGFINKNLNWIENKLKKYKLERSKYLYLGNHINSLNRYITKYKYFNYISNKSILEAGTDDDSISDYDLYLEFLKIKAEEYIPKRVAEFAGEYGFNYNKVRIKLLTSSWGSCSIKKNLSFNLKLMYFNYKIVDYVIVHELCHLKVMNHSKKFWDLVEGILPDYKERKSALKINKY